MEFLSYSFIITSVIFLLSYNKFFQKNSFGKIIVILSLFVLISASQILDKVQYTYPFVSWTMYSSPFPSGNYYEYIIESSEGHKKHYPFSIINHISPRAFMRNIENFEREITLSRKDNKNAMEDYEVEKMIEGLIRIYSERFPHDEITRFEINGVLISYQDSKVKIMDRYNYYTYTRK
jgi:hypothetical protein